MGDFAPSPTGARARPCPIDFSRLGLQQLAEADPLRGAWWSVYQWPEGACAHTFAAFTIDCHMGYAQTPLMVQKMQLRSRKQRQQAAMTSWLLNQDVDPSKWLMAKSLGKAWVSNISTSDFRRIAALALLEHHHIRLTGLMLCSLLNSVAPGCGGWNMSSRFHVWHVYKQKPCLLRKPISHPENETLFGRYGI